MLFARADFSARVVADLGRVPTHLPPREAMYRDALQYWHAGRFEAAAATYSEWLAAHPTDFLGIKLLQYLLFYLGDGQMMATASARTLPAWTADVPGEALIHGCHAFDCEEAGDLGRAERIGRAAVEREPLDLWGTHAVAHVLEMEGRAAEGIAWLQACEPHWGGANPFIGHVWWHKALFHLTLGQLDQALALYDGAVAGGCSDDTLDLANAISLLWRLQDQGVAIGERWQTLAPIAAKRAHDQLLPFLDLHLALAFQRAGAVGDLDQLVARLVIQANDNDTAGRVIAAVGLDMVRGIAALSHGSVTEARRLMVSAMRGLSAIGGSYAQRDVFWQATRAVGGDTPRQGYRV
jgi:tetratricopeptide (TPR) repeat protein